VGAVGTRPRVWSTAPRSGPNRDYRTCRWARRQAGAQDPADITANDAGHAIALDWDYSYDVVGRLTSVTDHTTTALGADPYGSPCSVRSTGSTATGDATACPPRSTTTATAPASPPRPSTLTTTTAHSGQPPTSADGGEPFGYRCGGQKSAASLDQYVHQLSPELTHILQAPFSRASVTSARAGSIRASARTVARSPVASACTQFVLSTATNDQCCPHVDLDIYTGQRHLPLIVNGTHGCRLTSSGSIRALS